MADSEHSDAAEPEWLEVNLLLRLFDIRTEWRFAPITWLFATIVYQLLVARRILALGYGTVWAAEIPIAPQQMAYKLRSGSRPPATGSAGPRHSTPARSRVMVTS